MRWNVWWNVALAVNAELRTLAPPLPHPPPPPLYPHSSRTSFLPSLTHKSTAENFLGDGSGGLRGVKGSGYVLMMAMPRSEAIKAEIWQQWGWGWGGLSHCYDVGLSYKWGGQMGGGRTMFFWCEAGELKWRDDAKQLLSRPLIMLYRGLIRELELLQLIIIVLFI